MVDEMKQLVREDVPRKEIAVLYRSNAQSRVMETALFNAGMPYKVYGGLRFFERAEIKTCAGLSAAAGEPARRHQFHARREFSAARHRRCAASSSCRMWRAPPAASLRDAVSWPGRQSGRQHRRFCGQDRRVARADPGHEPDAKSSSWCWTTAA